MESRDRRFEKPLESHSNRSQSCAAAAAAAAAAPVAAAVAAAAAVVAAAVVENETSGEGPMAVQGKAKGSGGGEASELPTRRIDGRGTRRAVGGGKAAEWGGFSV